MLLKYLKLCLNTIVPFKIYSYCNSWMNNGAYECILRYSYLNRCRK